MPQSPIYSFRPSIGDISELGEYIASEVQSHYINEYKEHIILINIDFNLEGSNLRKFASALTVLFAENGVDVESFTNDAYAEVGFDNSFLPKVVLYNKGDGTGTYKLNKGMQNFKNFVSSKRTNRLIYDVVGDTGVVGSALLDRDGRSAATAIKKIHMLRKTINENRGREQTSGVEPVNQAYSNFFKILVPSPKTKIKQKSPTPTTPAAPVRRPVRPRSGYGPAPESDALRVQPRGQPPCAEARRRSLRARARAEG